MTWIYGNLCLHRLHWCIATHAMGRKRDNKKQKGERLRMNEGRWGWMDGQCGEEGCWLKRKENGRGEKILQRTKKEGEISDNFRQYIKCRGSTSYFEISLIRVQLFFPHSHPQIYNPTCHFEKVRRYIVLRLSGSLGSCSDLWTYCTSSVGCSLENMLRIHEDVLHVDESSQHHKHTNEEITNILHFCQHW